MARGNDERHNPNRRPVDLRQDPSIGYPPGWLENAHANRGRPVSKLDDDMAAMRLKDYQQGMAAMDEALDDGFDEFQRYAQYAEEYLNAKKANPSLTRNDWFDQKNAENPDFEVNLRKEIVHHKNVLYPGSSIRDWFNDDALQDLENWEW